MRKASKIILATGIVSVLVHIVHARTLDRIIEYKEELFRSPDVPLEMDGYRLAFIADTHCMPPAQLQMVVEELNNRQVDLLLLGGDYSSDEDASFETMAILSKVKTTDGVFGVEGNHDTHETLFRAMEEYSITPLSNCGQCLREHFYLAGVEDLWNRQPNIADAISGATPQDFVILISHNPDTAMLQDTRGVDLILSGHTHGGQSTLFGMWAPSLVVNFSMSSRAITNYNQRFRSGWALSRDGVSVYVSNGAGQDRPRIFARPQVTLITLKKADSPGSCCLPGVQ